jgi:hypothetical protein
MFPLKALSNMNSQDWTSDEFMCFLMLYAAHADESFADTERLHIIHNCGQDVYDRVWPFFEKSDDYIRMESIASFRDKYIDTPEKKTIVLAEMKKVFTADNEFAKIEQQTLKMMEQVL